MPITVQYRISSGEVIKISPKGQLFPLRDQTYWGVLTDPTLPDGMMIRVVLPNKDEGPLRVLGLAKFADVPGNIVRNATQAEIDAFDAPEIDDEAQQDAAAAVEFLDTHPRFRKAFIAFADILRDEINVLRALHGLPDRTLPQFRNAIKNRISKDD